MKRNFYITLLMLCFNYPLLVYADDVSEGFMAFCTAEKNNSQSFCECSLNAFSDNFRERDEKGITIQELYLKQSTDGLLADSAITQDKLDAVCDIHDAALEYDVLSSLTKDPQKRRQLRFKQSELMQEKRALVESYQPHHQTAGSLISGNYCDLRAKVRQMQQDLSESSDPENSGQLYPRVRRILEINHPNSGNQIIHTGYKAQCSQ